MSRRVVIWAAIGVAVIAGIYFFTGAGKSANTARAGSEMVRVVTARAEQKDMPFDIKVAGNVVANQSVAIKSRVDSQIMEVRFHDGDDVNKGDVLFVLDQRALQSQVQQAQMNVTRDKATLEDMRLKYTRAKDLRAKGYETAANFDSAKMAYEAQQATVKNDQEAVKNAGVMLDYTVITAPISGRAGTINLTVGNYVKANDTQPLVTLNEIKPVKAQAAVAQNFLAQLQDAMNKGPVPVSAWRDNDSAPIPGTLSYLENQIDQTTGTILVRAAFSNEDERLWPGMFINLTITLGEEKGAITVPAPAIQHGQQGDYVFIIVDGKAKKEAVRVSRVQDGLAVVASGIKPDDQVVTDGVLTLRDGAPVSVSYPQAAKGAKTDGKPDAPPETKPDSKP